MIGWHRGAPAWGANEEIAREWLFSDRVQSGRPAVLQVETRQVKGTPDLAVGGLGKSTGGILRLQDKIYDQ